MIIINFRDDTNKNDNTVYKYTNIVNSKVYIGRTMRDLKIRAGKNGAGYKSCSSFWNAIQEYGWDSFHLEILAEHVPYEESIELEAAYIKKYRSNEKEFGYNILSEQTRKGCILPDELKSKLSEARKYLTQEQRERIRLSHLGQKPWNKGIKTGSLTDEQKKNFSEARKGNKNSIHVPVRNVTTGQVFRSGAEAGRSINRTAEAIFWSIKHNKPCNGYYFERVNEEYA